MTYSLNKVYLVLFTHILLLLLLKIPGSLQQTYKYDDILPPPESKPCSFLLKMHELHFHTKAIGKKYGFQMESHDVETEDGYIIEIHRIPNPGKPVVYIQYGLFQSSRDMLLNCDRRSVAVRFADDGGYDVWLGNTRGNYYGRKHVKLSNQDDEFWDFSNDEIIRIDMPTTIDYILNKTQQPKLSFIGFSMGNAHMFGLLSHKPEYQQKIHFVFSMGATVKFSHTKSPFIRLFAPYAKYIERLFTRLTKGEVTANTLGGVMNRIGPYLCYRRSPVIPFDAGLAACLSALTVNDGYDPGQIDGNVLAAAISSAPSGGSIKMFTQWLQWVHSNKFAMYDYGYLKNLKIYGQESPPEYNISNVESRVFVFLGENDFVTAPRDVRESAKLLPNGKIIPVDRKTWNHVDNALGRDASYYIYDRMLNILKYLNETRKVLKA